MSTTYVVVQHDQGCREELEEFTTRAAARHWIEDTKEDQRVHPQWYRHLADPYYSIESITTNP